MRVCIYIYIHTRITRVYYNNIIQLIYCTNYTLYRRAWGALPLVERALDLIVRTCMTSNHFHELHVSLHTNTLYLSLSLWF